MYAAEVIQNITLSCIRLFEFTDEAEKVSAWRNRRLST